MDGSEGRPGAELPGPVPQVVGGRYVLGPRLGRGGVGEVHAAFDTVLRREVAVKLWHGLAGEAGSGRRLSREARTAARLTGPHVVTVLDHDAGAQQPYLVMERLPGCTWADVLRARPPADRTVAAVLADVLTALAGAHALGVVHRDVKPANVLLTAGGRVKLGDFGIAVAGDDTGLTRTGEVLGSAPYLAPERLQGGAPTGACDIWSAGVMAYEGFAGVRPFDGETPLMAAMAVLHGEHPPLDAVRPDLPADVVAAVGAAMDPDPRRRPTAAELRQVLTAAFGPPDGAGDPLLAAFVARHQGRAGSGADPGAAPGATADAGPGAVTRTVPVPGPPGPRRRPVTTPVRPAAALAAVALLAAVGGVGVAAGAALDGGTPPPAAAAGRDAWSPAPLAPTTAAGTPSPDATREEPPATRPPATRTTTVVVRAAPGRPSEDAATKNGDPGPDKSEGTGKGKGKGEGPGKDKGGPGKGKGGD